MTSRHLGPACATAGVDMYPDPDDKPAIAAAVAVCDRCPIKEQCAGRALANREEFGVWGGLTEARRREMNPHKKVPAHVPVRQAAAARRCEVAKLAAQNLAPAVIAARLGVPANRVRRDLLDGGASERAERAAARAEQLAARDARIDAMLAAGATAYRIRLELRVGARAISRRADLQNATTKEAA
ncbi:WhiB family transcriptional regulator [Dactylosporangium salmoneum]|uniref:Transcriptional regulator WhiB n=1 Tax=Dactylosporangium salmoneum TaxID=53361 RepID=A0ABN3G9Z4_9ACTN